MYRQFPTLNWQMANMRQNDYKHPFSPATVHTHTHTRSTHISHILQIGFSAADEYEMIWKTKTEKPYAVGVRNYDYLATVHPPTAAT